MALTLESLKPIFPKYDYKYTDRPKEACSTYLSEKNPFNLPPASELEGEHAPPLQHSYSKEPDTKVIDWKGKSRGLIFHHPQGNVNVICVKLSEECKSPVPVICRERTKTRCTQTRYRESSAQTRPYLPNVAGNKENYQHFEIYQISKLLDRDAPPGEYEVKVIERIRRRHQYEKALQAVKNDKEKHNKILEAMEWEDWVAREEDIQGCQMLRMEIVERMFDERQNKLQRKAEKRISCSTSRIQSKRALQLDKINIEFARDMRRLETKKRNITRNYRKGNIIQEHIDPASDLHAPQMRFGVNPNRRHFVGFRKTFDDRIEDLNKQRDDRGLASLTCPFSKLRNWSKPKQRLREVTQNFCSDENLKNLYESLKGLRTTSEAPKSSPKCLKKKTKPLKIDVTVVNKNTDYESTPEMPKTDRKEEDQIEIEELEESSIKNDDLIECLRKRRSKDMASKTDEEIRIMLGEFEGTTLGKLFVFLNEELERLNQQKKFQAIQMLAERERWKREAIEAGQRQRENKARDDKEKLYKAACDVHSDTAAMFLESVLEDEFKFNAEALSTERITDLATEIDKRDSAFWEGEGRSYNRMVISDYVKNQVFDVAEKLFTKFKFEKFNEDQLRAIEEELYAEVEKALAAKYNIPDSVCIVAEFMDELIDNSVNYDFDILSARSSDDKFDVAREIDEIIDKLVKVSVERQHSAAAFIDSTEFQTKLTAEKEAKAVIRKLVRRLVPEQRWKEEGERVVEQTLSDAFNEAIYEVECLKASRYVRNNERLNSIISEAYNRIDGYKTMEGNFEDNSSDSTLSVYLRSIRSKLDIFERFSDTDSDESHVNSFQESIRTDYIDLRSLKKYEPATVRLYEGRCDLIGNNANDYLQRKEQGEECEVTLPDVSSSESSNSARYSYTSQYLNIARSRTFYSPWIKKIHPGFADDTGQVSGRGNIRMSKSYERASIRYEDLSVGYRKSKSQERRSSC